MPDPHRGDHRSGKLFAPVILCGLLIVGVSRYLTDNFGTTPGSATPAPNATVRDQGEPASKAVASAETAVASKPPPAPSPPKPETPRDAPAKARPETGGSNLDSLARFINKGAFFGCKSRETFDRIGRLVASGDREAFSDLLRVSLSAGECIAWKEDTKVFVDKGGLASSCLRKQGEISCYWTINEAIWRSRG